MVEVEFCCFYLLLLAMGMMLDHPVCMERNGSVKKVFRQAVYLST